MKNLGTILILLGMLHAAPAHAIANFQHIVIIVQENRTPDNLFYALCNIRSCSTTPDASQYDVQIDNWLDKSAPGGTITPTSVVLNNTYDLDHSHSAFLSMCDNQTSPDVCKMDGAAGEACSPAQNTQCPPNPQFQYVDGTTGDLDPYLALATQYGWANYMFQTNQGPSFPAHQFLFGATSAPSQSDDQNGTFAAENYMIGGGSGCLSGHDVQLIDEYGNEDQMALPCFNHDTLPSLLVPGGISWRYYGVQWENGTDSFDQDYWNAPVAIQDICEPIVHYRCTGTAWTNNVDTSTTSPADVLDDISTNCSLRGVSWVTPTGQNSDHAKDNDGGGPSWVGSIVNAIGQSKCTDNGVSYWDDTAIIIVWDDWGGWYDHERPTFLAFPQGAYQYGFRVPMIFVSAYTPSATIDNTNPLDFGAIVNFVEHNFSIREGALGFADARSMQDLREFYNLNNSPRAFVQIPTRKNANWFLHDKSPPLPPDND